MKAVVINQYGTTSEFKEADVQPAELKPDEVTVAVHAFSINPMDVAGRMGMLSAPFITNWYFPVILGWDFSGVITRVGQTVTTFKVGDAVFGTLPADHAGNNGSYSTELNVPAALIVPKGDDLSFVQAAALPIAGGTAYQAITEGLQVKRGDIVLIQGGAGGVGLFGVQIAKALGATVVTTASPDHQDLLTKLGADQVIDYHTTKVADVVNDVDAVFDTAGDIAGGLSVLRAGGRLVSVGQQPTEEQSQLPDKQVSFQFSKGDPAYLTGLANLFADGKLTIITQSLPFTAANVAHAQDVVAGHHMTGKFVIEVQN